MYCLKRLPNKWLNTKKVLLVPFFTLYQNHLDSNPQTFLSFLDCCWTNWANERSLLNKNMSKIQNPFNENNFEKFSPILDSFLFSFIWFRDYQSERHFTDRHFTDTHSLNNDRLVDQLIDCRWNELLSIPYIVSAQMSVG